MEAGLGVAGQCGRAGEPLPSEHTFLICQSTIVEPLTAKERMVRFGKLGETELLRLLYILLRRVRELRLLRPSILPSNG